MLKISFSAMASSFFITLTFALFTILPYGQVEVNGMEKREVLYHHALMSIQTEYGDVYDCVPIYKQPSLGHPLLKNHKIQMRPDFTVRKELEEKDAHGMDPVSKVNCPPQSVPIRRTIESNPLDYYSPFEEGNGYHYAGIHIRKDTVNIVKGATAVMSIWNPHILNNQSSGAIVSIKNDQGPQHSFVKAGWVVDPTLYGDSQTRLFTKWMANGDVNTGCYNVRCPGFIQTDFRISLDSVLKASEHDDIYATRIGIRQDSKGWWLMIGLENTPIGYWPNEILPALVNGAPQAHWGGQIYYPPTDKYTPPPIMGNQIVVREWYHKCAVFSEVAFYDKDNNQVIPDGNTIEFLNPHFCYKAMYYRYNDFAKFHFFYGGPLVNGCHN